MVQSSPSPACVLDPPSSSLLALSPQGMIRRRASSVTHSHGESARRQRGLDVSLQGEELRTQRKIFHGECSLRAFQFARAVVFHSSSILVPPHENTEGQRKTVPRGEMYTCLSTIVRREAVKCCSPLHELPLVREPDSRALSLVFCCGPLCKLPLVREHDSGALS